MCELFEPRVHHPACLDRMIDDYTTSIRPTRYMWGSDPGAHTHVIIQECPRSCLNAHTPIFKRIPDFFRSNLTCTRDHSRVTPTAMITRFKPRSAHDNISGLPPLVCPHRLNGEHARLAYGYRNRFIRFQPRRAHTIIEGLRPDNFRDGNLAMRSESANKVSFLRYGHPPDAGLFLHYLVSFNFACVGSSAAYKYKSDIGLNIAIHTREAKWFTRDPFCHWLIDISATTSKQDSARQTTWSCIPQFLAGTTAAWVGFQSYVDT